MNIADIVVLSIIVVAIVFAVRRIIKKGGSCDCGSSSCPHSNSYNKQ
ncbi:FeoB-associated Cys-rich membrane protein [Finegoldia magna]|nr:FeoB-associated Cys-rich membrane protein [Finegoldia magna]MDU6879236.1 FeoB-associated Cys-rich membrane protein [Finegoldia magna]